MFAGQATQSRFSFRHLAALAALVGGFALGGGRLGADETKPTKQESASARKHLFKSYLGGKPPELQGDPAHWVNLPASLSLRKQVGKVVWLEFNF